MVVQRLSVAQVHEILEDCRGQLGEGTNGCVFFVYYGELECALKIGFDPSDRPQYTNEMERMELIGGAGGAPVPLGFCPEMPALLMTFCGAHNLSEHLDEEASVGTYDLEYILDLGLQVTERLQEIHAIDFVHCDLKSDNVSVRLNPSLRTLESVHIIDFGFARRVGERQRPREKVSCMEWYCDCMFTGAPLTPACDLPGLAYILKDLFYYRNDMPRELRRLASLCASTDHEERPSLDQVRECLLREIAECSQPSGCPSPASH
ncbi:uncharacterized protein LOC122248806 [Penaeus japonicus]|uniref:uncharacterized protein LOC122248806 n=1 Tax=Penaeus japonicus TaxID=27405 RepID=UPI001C7131A4|nr:uncharacterized protein LOC122248806 [Penaeus japonicus]